MYKSSRSNDSKKHLLVSFHSKLHLSVTITVPRIGVFFLNRIVLTPKRAKYKKDDNFIDYLNIDNTEFPIDTHINIHVLIIFFKMIRNI